MYMRKLPTTLNTKNVPGKSYSQFESEPYSRLAFQKENPVDITDTWYMFVTAIVVDFSRHLRRNYDLLCRSRKQSMSGSTPKCYALK